jgi:hypothetical protein
MAAPVCIFTPSAPRHSGRTFGFMKLLLNILVTVAVAVTTGAAAEPEIERATLLQVLAHPEKYDGKRLQLIGYLHLQFEGNALWLHKEDYDHAIIGNMVSIEVQGEIRKREKELNDEYVMVIGTFDAKDLGHMGLCSGTLKNITSCGFWPGPGPAKPKRTPAAEPGGSADGVQPFGSGTNRASGAAGPRR